MVVLPKVCARRVIMLLAVLGSNVASVFSMKSWHHWKAFSSVWTSHLVRLVFYTSCRDGNWFCFPGGSCPLKGGSLHRENKTS